MATEDQVTEQEQRTLPYELWEAFDPERIVKCDGCGRELVAPVGHEPCDTYCCIDCYRERNGSDIAAGLDAMEEGDWRDRA